ncbi:MAG: VCBS repeat-containing protein [Bacteroidetes bacterium]|nr:VCBS repeat-containing protein [Bacteroidota bacterium]MCW5897220.1 VCBS repeat-containing protein [Bacteroidota bacterium]
MRTYSFALTILLVFVCLSANSQTTFTDVTATAGTGLGDGTARGFSWVDFDNDGLLDLFIPTAGNVPNKVYKNNGDGTFSEIAAALGLNDMANTITCSWADFDNDGDLDLITTATAAATVLWRNNFFPGGDTSFTNITASSGIAMSGAQMPAWADYNLDGFLDVYSPISNSSVSSDALYRNNGDATFTNMADSAGVNHQVSGILEQAVHWGDFNKDGYADLFIGNLQTGGPSFFHRNNGDGTFTEIAASLGFQGAARGSQWVDYNNDGLWDYSVAGYAGGTNAVPVKLYRNNGDGTFTDAAAQAGITDAVISWGVTWADFDNDGYEDFFVTVSGQSTSCLLYKNNGDGTFTNVTSQAGLPAFAQLSAAWGDYDNDGDMDLYTSGAASAGNHLFRNNSDTTNKWLKVNLAGSTANRFGVGAQIEVYAGSLRMMREVNTAIGYRSQNMLTAHFGLAGNTLVDSVVVRWPNQQQTRTVQRNVHANQVLTLTEIPSQHVEELNSPLMWRLKQNYPNPFNPSTQITFTIPAPGSVRLRVFDILGKEVAVLVHETKAAGTYTVSWNAKALGSGVYFYRLEGSGVVLAKKMQLLK